MLMSGLFGEDLFDEFWGFPTHELANINDHVMDTDVLETKEGYELDMDLPGFKKDQINITLENGYMTVSAARDQEQNKKDSHGKLIRQERYAGTLQRSFYVGEAVKREDVKAKLEDGVLKLSIPKKELKALPGNNTIAIEG